MIRVFDIFFSAIALLILSPIFLLIIPILKLTGEGEVFYSQERIGKNLKTFNIIKFATMKKDSPSGTAIKIQKEFENLVRIDIDDRDINLNLKIKQVHKELIPNKIILGDKEDINQIKERIKEIANQNQEFEFLKLNSPHLLSQRHF